MMLCDFTRILPILEFCYGLKSLKVNKAAKPIILGFKLGSRSFEQPPCKGNSYKMQLQEQKETKTNKNHK